MSYRKLHNEELIDLLFMQEDRLPKTAAMEIVRRGDELMHDLTNIALDRLLWTAEPPDWWAPIHATYILGAIGTKRTIMPLISSLRWSDAYDNEWVADDLPSIFGVIGLDARKPLERAVADPSAGWSARAIAMDALAAIAVRHPHIEEQVMRTVVAILKDSKEEHGARRAAALILLDFKRSDYAKALMRFAGEESERFKDNPAFEGGLFPEAIERELARGQRDVSFFTRDWMHFYEPDEIRMRQRRWAEEEQKYRLRPQLRPGDASRLHAPAGDVRPEDPCPCGSGKSYRRCCWLKLH